MDEGKPGGREKGKERQIETEKKDRDFEAWYIPLAHRQAWCIAAREGERERKI